MNVRTLCVLCALGDLLSIFWIFGACKSRFRFSDIQKAADRELFPLPYLLKPGFQILQWLKISAEKGIQKLSGKPGEARMSPFDAYCTAAWAIGAGVPILTASAFIAAMAGEGALLFLGGVLGGTVAYLPLYRFRTRKKEKTAEVEQTLPAILSKTVLLNDAGLTFADTWHTVAVSADGEAYREMRKAEELMKNGVPAEEALLQFAEHCNVRDAHQFVGILLRQKTKGGEDSSAALRFLNSESWEKRKQRAKVKTAAASEAMMLPMLMIFIGILMMVIVPLLLGIQI